IEEMYPELHIINPAIKQVMLLKEYMEKTGIMNDGSINDRVTKICTTGSSEDYCIFEEMICQLNIICDDLVQVSLDIE
ncbi:MAG: glutamate racemase, partial [Eubacterium sp.]